MNIKSSNLRKCDFFGKERFPKCFLDKDRRTPIEETFSLFPGRFIGVSWRFPFPGRFGYVVRHPGGVSVYPRVEHMPSEWLELISISHSKLRALHLGNTRNLVDISIKGCKDLVELYMPTEFRNLVSLTVSQSKLQTLHLGVSPYLKSLNLEKCHDLVELHMPSECLELISLDLTDLKLKTLDLGLTPKLETLSLRYCHNLVSICGWQSLRRLALKGCEIQEVPKHLDQLECLEELSLCCMDIRYLPDSICMLQHLKSLEIKSCLCIESLPNHLGRLECLEKVRLYHCVNLRDIPNSIFDVKRLKYLDLTYCTRVENLPEEIGCLECLEELNITGTFIRHLPQRIFHIKGLRIIGSTKILEACGFTSDKIQTSDDDNTFCYI